MSKRKLGRARQIWLGSLLVLPDLLLTLTAGGPHQHRQLRQCWVKHSVSGNLVGKTAPQIGSEDREARCLACVWLSQTNTQGHATLLLPSPVGLETLQLTPAVLAIISTPLSYSSRAPPLV